MTEGYELGVPSATLGNILNDTQISFRILISEWY